MVKLILTVVEILVLVVVPLGAFLLGLATGRPYLRLLLAKPGVLLRFFLATFVIMPALIVVGFVACAILIGHLLGGPPPELRPTLAAALATRRLPPALALTAVNHSTREVAPVLITYLFAGVLLMMLYGRLVTRPELHNH